MKPINITEAETEIMEILWKQRTSFMKDILEILPEPKLAATTVATLLKRLQNKDLVGYKTFGNSREYFPKVEKKQYFNHEMSGVLNRFFNNSAGQFASYFTANAKLSQEELQELRDIIDQQIKD